jgi:hypothetical protein
LRARIVISKCLSRRKQNFLYPTTGLSTTFNGLGVFLIEMFPGPSKKKKVNKVAIVLVPILVFHASLGLPQNEDLTQAQLRHSFKLIRAIATVLIISPRLWHGGAGKKTG